MTYTQPLSKLLRDKSLLKDKCYINGGWVGSAATITVTNPVDESAIGIVPKLGGAETRIAIEDAQELLEVLDALIDLGDRRSAALEQTEAFKQIQRGI